MKHLFMRYLLASSLLTIGMPLWAEDFRVGFINTDRIFREANTAKVAQTKLEQEFSKREKELVDLVSESLGKTVDSIVVGMSIVTQIVTIQIRTHHSIDSKLILVVFDA